MGFENFSLKISEQINKTYGELFRVDIDKDELWDLYLDSFPGGTNQIYKERREFDCNICKNFIRDMGNVVTISDDMKYQTIWDVDVEEPFQTVANKISRELNKRAIENKFMTDTKDFGMKTSTQLSPDKRHVKFWDHFYCKIDGISTVKLNDQPTLLSRNRSSFDVLKRGLCETTWCAINQVLELIENNQLYRGEEFKQTILEFKDLKIEYDHKSDLYKDRYVWLNIHKKCARIRNTSIGTLLQNLSNDMDLDSAVKKFETIVAPTNYKRPKPIITKRMIDEAMKTIEKDDLKDSLYRRYANITDISVNDILFADRSVQPMMKDCLKSSLMDSVKPADVKIEKTEDINIDDFIKNIIPKTNTLQVMFENKHENNLVSLIAPKHGDATPLFKWENPFSWSYNGDLTDSIKERVKKAGGKVDGFLRVSLSWQNRDDLDIHIEQPNGNEIYYGNKVDGVTGGELDIDMNAVDTVTNPVENIVWMDPKLMLGGTYRVYVNNYRKRDSNNHGFEVELECGETLLKLNYDKPVQNREDVFVMRFDFNRVNKTINILKTNSKCGWGMISKDVWNLKTNRFQDVSLMTLSPNHWESSTPTGNKHYMFIINGCKNPGETRGFYNEYLPEKYMNHRKVFETLADKTKCEKSDDQLSGVGFSSTVQNSIVCKVNKGKTYKVNFGK